MSSLETSHRDPEPDRDLEASSSPGTSPSTSVSFGRGLILGLATLILVGLLSWWSLAQIEEQTRHDLEGMLSTVLHTTQEALHIWSREREADLAAWADSPRLQQMAQSLLQSGWTTREALLASPELTELRSLFREVLDRQGYLGFALISPDHLTLAATEDSLVGSIHLLAKNGNYLERVFDGETLVSLPMVAEVLLPNPFGEYAKDQPTMFVVGPVHNTLGEVIAALAFRIDPNKDFTRITQLGRIGQSGETYAFSADGKLLTESRFDQHLIQTGLLRPGERAILSVEIRDPGGNLVEGFKPTRPREEQPLTEMAARATDGESGANLTGYRDYRGVPVVGVWLWDKELGMGLTTQMDVAEAFASFKSTRLLVINTLVLILVLFLAFSIAQARGRVQALKLADRIRERETQISAVLDNVADAILIIDARDRIESFNNAAETIFGYTDTEVIGRPFRLLLAQEPGNPAPDSGGEPPMDFESLAQRPDLQGVRKDGSVFPMEMKFSRVRFKDRTLTIVIVRDISERKRAEEEIRKGRDELENRVRERTADLQAALSHIEAEVAKRQAFEKELRDSNAFLTSILDSPTDISIVSTDLKGKILYWNRGAENLLGYSAEEMVGKQTVEVLYPPDGDSRQLAAEMATRIMQTKRGASFEVEELTRDGRRIWVHLTLSPRFNEAGEVVGILGIGGNITDLKQNEAALETQSTYLQMLEEVALASSQAPDPESALKTCLDQVCTVLHWPIANLFLPAEDASGDLVCSPIHHNREPALLRNFRKLTEVSRFARGEGLPGRVLQTAAPCWVAHLDEDLNPVRAREARRAGLQSGFAFPITFGSEVLGVMEFFSLEARPHDPRLFEVMAQVGHQMGRILNRKRADRLLRRTRDFLQLYQGLAEAAYGALTLEESLQAAVDQLCAVHGWSVGHLLLPAGESPDTWVSAGIWHVEDPDAARNFRKVSEEMRFSSSGGFPGRVAETRNALWLNDLETHHDFDRARLARGLGLVSAWAFPLVHQQQVLGILEAFGRNQAKPDKEFLEGMREVCGLLGHLLDLRRREEATRRLAQTHRAVVEQAPVGIVTLDRDGTIVSLNAAAGYLLGYSPEEAVGKNVSVILPDAYSGGEEAWLIQAAAQSGAFNGAIHRQVMGLRSNGTPVPLTLGVSHGVVDGQELYVLTLHYTAQAALRPERKAPARVADPEPRAAKPDQPLDLPAPQRRVSLGEQLTEVANQTLMAAHEFDSPVFGVRRLVEHLRGLLPLEEHPKVLFDLLERKCRRLSEHFRKLREFYRPQSAVGGPVDVNEVLEDILVLNRPLFQSRGIKLEKHLARDLPKIDAVPDQIHQALQNLVRHSEERLPPEGGELMMVTEQENGWVKIYLLDNGNGLAPGHLEALFEPVSALTGEAAAAADLPLQFSVNVIKTHGGSIEIGPREGRGTIYTVSFPVPGTR